MEFDINLVRGLQTLALLLLFIWLTVWAYSKKQQPAFDEAANLPFADDNLNATSSSASKADTPKISGEHA